MQTFHAFVYSTKHFLSVEEQKEEHLDQYDGRKHLMKQNSKEE